MQYISYRNGAYRTEPRIIPSFARAFPSFAFHFKNLRIVLTAGRKAKRGPYVTGDWVSSSFAILRALESVGVRFEITGVDHFREIKGPCVFIANHMSTLETFVLPCIISSFIESTFIVKKSLVDMPVFKYVMRSRNPITVGRVNPREDLKTILEEGTERLGRGISVVVFPQATRSFIFAPPQFNTIGIKLAKRAGVPAVPVALKTDAWAEGRYIPDLGKIDPAKTAHISFGKPLIINDRGTKEHQEIIDFIRGKLLEWGGEISPAA